MHTHTNTALSRALKPMTLKTCACDFQLRLHSLLCGAPKQPQSCVQFSPVPLGALGDRAFWEWQEQCSSCLAFEGSPSAPAEQAVPLLGRARLSCQAVSLPGLHRKPVCLSASLHVTSVQLRSSWSQPCWSRAVLLPLHSFSSCPFRGSAEKWFGGAQA